MTVITIETENSQFVKAIVALCKAMGITSVRTSANGTEKPKRLREDLAARLDAIDNGTATLHTYETVEDLKQALFAETGVKL